METVSIVIDWKGLKGVIHWYGTTFNRDFTFECNDNVIVRHMGEEVLRFPYGEDLRELDCDLRYSINEYMRHFI